MTIPPMTALGGALVRHADGGWTWCDGEPEPRVSDLTLRDFAPNFRCVPYGSGTVVEIPHDWRAAKYWPAGRVDNDAVDAIEEMIAHHTCEPSPIYAEGLAEMLDDHRLRKSGYMVPLASWDGLMADVVGVTWPREHEADILARAESLRQAPT